MEWLSDNIAWILLVANILMLITGGWVARGRSRHTAAPSSDKSEKTNDGAEP
jgi:hypothetical protein